MCFTCSALHTCSTNFGNVNYFSKVCDLEMKVKKGEHLDSQYLTTLIKRGTFNICQYSAISDNINISKSLINGTLLLL